MGVEFIGMIGTQVASEVHPPPANETALRERLELGKKGEVKQTDWYFSKKQI